MLARGDQLFLWTENSLNFQTEQKNERLLRLQKFQLNENCWQFSNLTVYQIVEVFDWHRDGRNKACIRSGRQIGISKFLKRKEFFCISGLLVFQRQGKKVSFQLIGFHLFKIVGLDFDRETSTIDVEISV